MTDGSEGGFRLGRRSETTHVQGTQSLYPTCYLVLFGACDMQIYIFD
jgi:hypothetical protein